MAFFQSAARALGTAYDYLTPGRGSSRLTDYGNRAAPRPQQPKTPEQPPIFTSPVSNMDAQIAALRAQTNALMAQLAQQPRLPFYNTSAAWAQAQKAAQGVVDPVYTDKLNQYLEKQRLGISQQTAEAGAQKEDITTRLQQALEDVATSRTQTEEDVATTLGDVATTEEAFQTNEARQFTAAREALLGGISGAGLTTSGLGRQQEAQAITGRNIATTQQAREFETTRRDIGTKATRTFASLETTAGRAKKVKEVGIANVERALKDFIDMSGLEEREFRTLNEAERLAALGQSTEQQYKLGIDQFIASLVGKKGSRAQDIALARQVYG